MANSKISELTYLGSGSINSLSSMVEIVQTGTNYRTTPKDFVQSAIPIDINALPTGSAPVITTASNLGTGVGIYSQKVGNDLQFKSLIAGTNITLSSSSVGITVTATASTGSATLKRFTLSENMDVGDQVVIRPNDGWIRKLQFDSFGADASFNSALDAAPIITSRLTDTKFLVNYADLSGNSYRAVKIGTVAADYTITFGSEYKFNEETAYQSSNGLAVLSDTKFVVSSRDYGVGTTFGQMKLGTISNEVITYGSAVYFPSATTGQSWSDMKPLTTDKVVFLDTASYNLIGIIATVSGTSLSLGSSYILVSGQYVKNTCLDVLTTSKFIFSYTNGTSGTVSAMTGSVQIGIVEGTVIYASGSSVIYDTGHISQYPDITTLTENVAILGYSNIDGDGIVRICNISGDSVTLGNPYIFSSGSSNVLGKRVIALDIDRFMIYYDQGGLAMMQMGTISGSVISFPGSSYSFSGEIEDVSKLSSFAVVVAWDATQVGKSKAGPISSFTISDKIAGILQESGTTGQSKPVALFGDISSVHSGLTPSYLYYYDTSTGHDVVEAPVGRLAGLAISSTELKIVSYQ